MGLSIAISGGIVTFSIVYAMMSFTTVVDDSTKIRTSQSVMSDNLLSRLQTNIGISNLQDQSGINPATFQISNTGNTILWNYDKFDLIVTYQENGTLVQQLLGIHPIVTETLNYAKSCTGLGSDKWCISQIQNDNIHPGLIDPSEIASIEAEPAHITKSGGTFTVEFGTDNGITASNSVITS